MLNFITTFMRLLAHEHGALTEASPVNRTVREVGMKFPIVLSGTVNAGDLIGYDSGWKQALATVGTVIDGRFVALEPGVSGDIIEVAPAAIIDGFTGITLGAAIYGAEGTSNGEYTETAPTTGSDLNTIIGYGISSTAIYVNPTMRADSAV